VGTLLVLVVRVIVEAGTWVLGGLFNQSRGDVAAIQAVGFLADCSQQSRTHGIAVAFNDKHQGHREDAHMKATAGTLSALDVIYSRRSVRAYTQEKVPESTVRSLIDAAVQAPTALGTPSSSFVVVQNQRSLARLSELSKTLWGEQASTHPERFLHLRFDAGEEFLARLSDPHFDIFHGATTLIVICARGTEWWETAGCWMAAENLMLAASALGLGTCCIGAAVDALNTAEIRLELAISPNLTAVAPIVVGMPAAQSAPMERPPADVVAWK
jgi:nitroreductase